MARDRPYEQDPNPYLDHMVEFDYLFSRKVMFAKLEVLIIDEWLWESLPQIHANEILDLVDARF